MEKVGVGKRSMPSFLVEAEEKVSIWVYMYCGVCVCVPVYVQSGMGELSFVCSWVCLSSVHVGVCMEVGGMTAGILLYFYYSYKRLWISVCVCVCVCVWEGKDKKETQRRNKKSGKRKSERRSLAFWAPVAKYIISFKSVVDLTSKCLVHGDIHTGSLVVTCCLSWHDRVCECVNTYLCVCVCVYV